ncbi:MAG: TerC family protein [Rhodospirillales bacterium]|nr:TerC family protein [Rhodospirillales bacterium]
MLDLLFDPQAWISLLTLTTMEIVLGIDNLVFIAILAGRLPAHQQSMARRVGLGLALFTRLALLAGITWIMHLTYPVFSALGFTFSWRDLILIGGGLFLVWKGTSEIHHRLEDTEAGGPKAGAHASLTGTIVQIIALDIIFSLDSVITAVGMASDLAIMMAAVIIAVFVMLVAAGPLSTFIGRHPTVKMLALSFLLLIGMTLMADGFGFHVPKGYVYAAMGFSALVESLNLIASRRGRPATR